MATEESSSKPVIECRPNGPLLVKGLKTLRDAKGAAIEVGETIALCRCGASAKKPFCDGTHKRVGFSGEKLPDRAPDRRDSYAGRRLAIHDNRGACSHAGICTERLGAVWRMGTEPWIDPDGADEAAIVEVIEACPSGALSYTLDGDEPMEEPRDPAIDIEGGGPYRVAGGIELANTEFGAGSSREKFTLCRCGASMNKPFCDGSHWRVEFDAPGADEPG